MSLGSLFAKAALAGLGRLPDDVLRAGARGVFSGSWRRFLEATARPRETQSARLLALVERARDTAFGREHGFGHIRSIEDYQRQVPIRGWEEFAPYVERMLLGEAGVLTPDAPFFYARTSGTTGKPKYVPINPVYVAEYRNPRRVWARQVMQAFPGLVRGKLLTVHSPKIEGRTPRGLPYGAVTLGLTARAQEGAVQESPLDVAPRSLFLLDDFDLKYAALLRLAAQEKVSLAASINPSTLMLLAEKLDAAGERLARELESGTFGRLGELPEPLRTQIGARLKKNEKAAARLRGSLEQHGRVIATKLWPNLSGLLSWKGGSAPFYLAQLERYFPDLKVMDYGYLATEGGFSIPLSPDSAGGVISVLGHFLEFVPEEARARGAAEPALCADALEVGARYRVVITGAHGLYRYDIEDVVECVGRFQETAEIAFVHKGGNMISVTGEKVGERHVVEAASRAQAETGVELTGFAVTCELCHPPRYVLMVEPRAPLDALAARRLLEAFERGLGAVNVEYAAKRSSSRLGPPCLRFLDRGAFEAERARRVAAGAPDAQVKPPHLVRDAEMLKQRLVEGELVIEGLA